MNNIPPVLKAFTKLIGTFLRTVYPSSQTVDMQPNPTDTRLLVLVGRLSEIAAASKPAGASSPRYASAMSSRDSSEDDNTTFLFRLSRTGPKFQLLAFGKSQTSNNFRVLSTFFLDESVFASVAEFEHSTGWREHRIVFCAYRLL